MLYIFDLDGTTVDSSARTGATLDDWFAMNTPANIALDKLLPLAQLLQMANDRGDATMVCTSRQMTSADYQFLKDKNINPVFILSRKQGDNTPCGAMKLDLLTRFCKRMGYAWGDFIKSSVMFDDNDDVLNTMNANNLPIIDARKYS
jgi:hypothetical protein|tara:strand:+ start:9114 stop:9554 length:441 start_codon:yes stop_codon:yes gene_type:complete